MPTKTNISDLNTSGNGPNRLSAIRGGIAVGGTISVGLIYGSATNSWNVNGLPPIGQAYRSTSSAITTTALANPIFTASASTGFTASVSNGYILSAGTLVTVTLPTSFVVGSQIGIIGQGAGGWKLAAGTATTIQYGTSATSSAGSLSSSNQYDNIVVMGIVANTTWVVLRVTSSGLTVL